MQTTERLTHEEARAAFERAYELLNEHDLRRIPDVFTEDVVFEDDAWPEIVRGHAALERFLRAIWTAMPDLRFELVDGPFLAEDGRSAAKVRIRGTMTGPLDPPGFAPTGGPVNQEYAGFYVWEGERVKTARIIINMQQAGVQIGAIPPPGSRGERAGVLLQRLKARSLRRRARA